MLDDILNAVGNVDDHEYYGFRGSLIKIAPTALYYYTKKKLLNMQLENLRPQRNIENNDKKSDEIYQKNMIYEKESDERDLFVEKKEETLNTDIEVLKLRKLSSQKNIDYLGK